MSHPTRESTTRLPRLAVSFLLASCLTAACASVGAPFDTTHVNDIRRGEHDRGHVRTWFGEPHHLIALSDHPQGCVERWQYTHAESTYGGSTTSQSLIVDFDASGRVCDNAYSRMNQ